MNPASEGIRFWGLKLLFRGREFCCSAAFRQGGRFVRGPIPQVLITVVTGNAPWQICCLAVDDDGAAECEHGAGIPEYVVTHWWQQILHNQTALRFKTRLLFTPGVVVVSVPYHLGVGEEGWMGRRRREVEPETETM